MQYSHVLFDLDHTLLDSSASESAAFANTLRTAGVADPGELFPIYDRINRSLWADLEAAKTTLEELRLQRFLRLVAESGLDADPSQLADRYVRELGANGDLLPGASAVLDCLAGKVSLSLITNGLSEVQRARISRLALVPYFDTIVISEEVGAAKPSAEIFDIVFDRLDWPPKVGCIIVGDSLSSDVRGGIEYGIDTCWYNPARLPAQDLPISHEIHDLEQLPPIVRGVS